MRIWLRGSSIRNLQFSERGIHPHPILSPEGEGVADKDNSIGGDRLRRGHRGQELHAEVPWGS